VLPDQNRVSRGDWSQLSPPPIGAWTPTLSVSVVIPAYDCQADLDLTLAALSHQTYPADLLEVIVVDDGSRPALRLPEIRPERCRIVQVTDGWGIANAVNTGAARATGEILHRLDADMVVFPGHVEALARWHHVSPYAVTLGYKRFVDHARSTPEEIAKRCADGTIGELFPDSSPHEYIEELIDSTEQLRGGDHLNFLVHVGATVALRRDLYLATGGLDHELVLGEDTEFGYRLAQAGALFIPEPAARSWHLGPSSMMTRGTELRRFNRPHLADLMPQPRWLRGGAGRVWRVPLVTAVVSGVDSSSGYELVRTCVDRLLASDEHDLRVVLIGAWDTLTDVRRDVLADPLLDLRLIAATYRSEQRVRLATEAPDTVFPSPYRLDVPCDAGVGPATVGRLVAAADKARAGVVRAGRLTLWRTAAVSRAHRDQRPGESLMDAVSAVHGQLSLPVPEVIDLAGLPPDRLTSPTRLAASATDVVVVAGVRSLLRAAGLVARRALVRSRPGNKVRG
jgi:GT2 family glycosyltransferase